MIQDQTTKVIYVGNGQTTHFPFKFKYNDKAHIHVAIYDIDTQVQTELTKDFFVDSEKNEVIYPGYQSGQEPPEAQIPPVLQANQKLVIYRQTPLTQEIDFGSKYPLPFVENGTDKNTMISQEMKEALERSVKVDMGSEVKPDELLTDIKQNVADANQSAQNAQQSADEAQEYAQNANANAQSINIRTFPNVESMKQANNLKTGGLIKTQGFYQPNDGGGADYVIVDDIGEDEVDEASIIALQKGLYARLLVQDYVNVKQFGAKGNGVTDDTEALQRAIDFGGNVLVPDGNYVISNTLEIDVQKTSLEGLSGNARFVTADSFPADICMLHFFHDIKDSEGFRKRYQQLRRIGNFSLTGKYNEKVVNGIGIGDIEGTDLIGLAGCNFYNISFSNMNKSLVMGSHVYINQFTHLLFEVMLNYFIYNPENTHDSGESNVFINCVFYVGRIYGKNSSATFYGCVLHLESSYTENNLKGNYFENGTWCFTDCHFEILNHSAEKTFKRMFEANGAVVNIYGGEWIESDEKFIYTECMFYAKKNTRNSPSIISIENSSMKYFLGAVYSNDNAPLCIGNVYIKGAGTYFDYDEDYVRVPIYDKTITTLKNNKMGEQLTFDTTHNSTVGTVSTIEEDDGTVFTWSGLSGVAGKIGLYKKVPVKNHRVAVIKINLILQTIGLQAQASWSGSTGDGYSFMCITENGDLLPIDNTVEIYSQKTASTENAEFSFGYMAVPIPCNADYILLGVGFNKTNQIRETDTIKFKVKHVSCELI